MPVRPPVIQLRIQGGGQREGPIVRRLHVAELPRRGLRIRRLPLRQGLDPEVLNATSDHDALNVAITDILSNNMLDLRTEIVQEMESGLCRNLLEPRGERPLLRHKPPTKGEPMRPLVLGTTFRFFAMLVAALLAGRQSVCLRLFRILFQPGWPLGTTSAVPREGPRELG